MSSLSHHGIKGQRWGVRRFQNKDGTRTAAGKAREDRRVLKKGHVVSRVHLQNKDKIYDNKKYVSTNDEDHKKWVGYFGNEYAHRWKPIYEQKYELKKDVYVANGKDVAKIISTKLNKEMVERDLKGLEAEAKAINYDWAKSSTEDRYSLLLARQTKSGKQVVKELIKAGFGAVEDDHGKNVAKDPVIILNPKKNLKKKGKTVENREYLNAYSQWYTQELLKAFGMQHTSIGGTMYIEGNALILGDSSYLEHHGILGQKWGVRRFQNKDGTRTAAGKARDAESLRSSQEAKNVNSKIHSYINRQLSSEDLDTGKSNYDFASDLIKDPDFEKVIMPVVQDIHQTKAKYGNKEPYEFTGDEHQAYMNDISRIDNKTGELAITIGLAEKGEPHKKSTPPEGEYERVDMFRYALARYLDEHSPDGYSDEGDWIYHSSMEGGLFIEDGTLYLSHHGIRGQRWGVRRFQNRDGSLTNAGRKRLGYATKGAAQTVGKAFKAGVKAGGKAVKAVKAHHEKAEAKKKEKKKEKASKTRLGVMANKDLFTNEELRKLNDRFKLEDEMKMATLQKGVEIAKAVGTIAQNVGTVAKTYEDITGTSLSPIKRKAAEEKARQDKEDRERRIAREDADEARKVAKEERDIAIHEQTLRKAIASADTQEFTANKTKAEADSSILDLYKKGQDFNGGTDATGQSWVEKAKSGGKNPFDDMIANRDPEYAQIRKEHDEKVARKERMEYLERREKEREAEKSAAKKQSAPQQKQGGGDDDALFSQKGSLPIDKDRYRNNRAMEKAKQVKEDAAEERAKKQDEKAAKATIDDMMEARRQFTDSARANSNGAFDRETAANYIKGKAKELPNKLNPVNVIAKKITNKALKEEEDNARKAMEDEYKKASRSQGRDEANYTMYYNRVNALQAQGYSERQAKKVADTENPFSSKRNRRFEYNEKVGEIETTHRKNAKEINKANKELTDYYYKLVNGPGYEPGSPKREALDRKYAQKRGELERLEKDNNEMLDREKKKAKKILEHSFSIQNGVLFIDSSYGLAHHGVKGQRWGVRRFQNEDGSLTDKGRKHYEKAIEKLDRKQTHSDAIRGRLERQHPFAVTGSAILGAVAAGMSIAATGGASVAAIAAGSAISAAVNAGITHASYSVSEAWEGRGTKRRQKKRKEYEELLNHADVEEGMYHVENGTLFINAGEPYLEHHGVLGMKWGKHLRAGKGPADASASAGGGGGGEDDEKLKEMAKKAGMSLAEYKQKFASKIGGAASKVEKKLGITHETTHKPKEKKKSFGKRLEEKLGVTHEKTHKLKQSKEAKPKKSLGKRIEEKLGIEHEKTRGKKQSKEAKRIEDMYKDAARKDKAFSGTSPKAKKKVRIESASAMGFSTNNPYSIPVDARRWGYNGTNKSRVSVGKRGSMPKTALNPKHTDTSHRKKSVGEVMNNARKEQTPGSTPISKPTQYTHANRPRAREKYFKLGQESKGVKKRKRRAKHFDDTNAIYTEGTRLVIGPKA